MTDWQKRVVTEKAEVDDRLGKLRLFIADRTPFEKAGAVQRLLMRGQVRCMAEYSDFLAARIRDFGVSA